MLRTDSINQLKKLAKYTLTFLYIGTECCNFTIELKLNKKETHECKQRKT